MDVKEFFKKAKDICLDNIGACQECPLTDFCSAGIFYDTEEEIDELIEIVTKKYDKKMIEYQEAIKRINKMGDKCGFVDACDDYDCSKCSAARKMAISTLEEIQQYMELGTVEELREAREKQKAKKPSFEGDGYDDEENMIYDTWICPCCNKDYEMDYEEYVYCPNCGQKIDWR